MTTQTRMKERITTKMAKEFLDSRRDNQRKISDRHVAELSDAMLYNRWRYNGEAIKFDEEGRMIDGQHRCAAGIKAGKSFMSDIVYGLPNDVYYVIDQKAKKRNFGDVLKIEGEINTAALASALGWHIAYTAHKISSRGKIWALTPDAQQVSQELRHHPAIRDSFIPASRCRHLLGTGVLTFVHYVFSQKDSDAADDFFRKLATGEELTRKNPILYIRRVLVADKVYNKAKLPAGEKIAYLIKGWNLIRKGKDAKSVASIKWTSAGKYPESFPSAI